MLKLSDKSKVSVAIAITLAFFLAELAGMCLLGNKEFRRCLRILTMWSSCLQDKQPGTHG